MYSIYWDEYKVATSHALIRKGSMRHMLYPAQREFYDYMKNPENDEGMMYASRKSGKSFVLSLIATEFANSAPNLIIRHIFPTLKTAKESISKIMSEIIPALPPELQPIYKISEAKYIFPNGSEYCLGGADPGSVSGNRGPRMNMFLADEVCYWEGDVDNHLKSVFFPQMTQVKNAKSIYASTPPEDIGHYSIKKIVPRLEAKHAFFKYTIYDSPLVDADQIAKIIERCGGEESNAFKREYLCELVVDTTRRIIPEFEDRHITAELPTGVNAFGVSTQYHGYQSADYGVGEQDLTGILSAVYDHNLGKIVVLGEALDYKPTLQGLTDLWNNMKTTHLENTYDFDGVLDAFEQAKNSLRQDPYNLHFLMPKKGKVVDNILFVRQCFESDKILIHESCKHLIKQLKEGIWDNKGKAFSRENEELGHLDLIAALVYLVRQVNWDRRPTVQRINLNLGRKTQKRDKNDIKERLRSLR